MKKLTLNKSMLRLLSEKGLKQLDGGGLKARLWEIYWHRYCEINTCPSIGAAGPGCGGQ